MYALGTVLVLVIAASSSTLASILAPKAFENIALGGIKPSGWLYEQLQVQTDGVAGHMHEFYDLVSKSDWVGGDAYYSYLEEAGSYWFNAMVPNGILINHTVINQKTQEFLDYVLDHQDSSGWLGPEVGTSKPRYLWGRYPFFFGAIQLIEHKPESTERVVNALHKFVKLANTMLKNGQGVDKWAETRWEDFVIALQWLHDKHPRGQEELLVDTMRRLKWSGAPWEKVFSEEWHGVNMAEGLKALPATYRFTHNASDLEAASLSWDLLFKYHGRPSGAFGADEMLAGLEANRGSELCLVVESMFSGSYLFQVMGDLKFADRVERMAYNALPATITANMWGRQYLQQQNQIAAKNMTPNPFPEDGPDSNIFGLEPNYPCCTVNFPQGWPKFITNAFLTANSTKSLVHLYLGPFDTNVTLANNNDVSVSVKTLYPFGDVLNYNISATKEFDFYIRIPSWVSGGSISVDYGPEEDLSPVNGLQKVSIKAGKTSLELRVPSEITIENRPHGSIAIHRGPLNYAFDIHRAERLLSIHPHENRAIDLEYTPTSTWQYALLLLSPTHPNSSSSSFKFHNGPLLPGSNLPSPIFDTGTPPTRITASVCRIEWGVGGDLFALNPPEDPVCVGPREVVTLWPFGATKLRISEFPVIYSDSETTTKEVQMGPDVDAQVPFHVQF
ncbi:hypothetical protein PQX77_000201 [Marasmius sp. AFHP31]|nr:hypothetical protein PQX77_000201 [Marasmius sp. AFHP31]